MKRIILFTGKGGVGKTTLSAATGAYLSTLGKRVIVISVDPAHSLSDVFETEIGPQPKEVAPNLFAQEIDVYYSVEKFWGKLQEYLKSLLRWQGVNSILAEEIAIFPGMEEVCCFLWINKHFEENFFEVIIVDSAPTGETLRLLSLPDAASWWVSKILPLQKKVMKFVRPAASLITDMPFPEDETYDALEDLFYQVYNLYHTLQNPEISSVRLVTNPEKMVLKETEKAYTYLHLFGFKVDGIFLNKTPLPGTKEHEIQQKYIEMIQKTFEPTPIFMIPHLKEEVLGFEKLRTLGQLIYQEKDPAQIFYKDRPFEIIEQAKKVILRLYLKEIPGEIPEIYKSEEELIIRIKNFKKHFYLPRSLVIREISEAKVKDSTIEIVFK